MRGRRRAAAVVAALLLATACQGGGGQARPSPSPTTTTLDALGTAIRGVNTTRAAVLADLAVVVEGPRAVDRGDESAAAGRRREAAAQRAAMDAAARNRDAAATRIPKSLAAYTAAVAALDRAAKAPDLPPDAAAALAAVVRNAAGEQAAYARFLVAANGTWAEYRKIVEAHRTWATRARAGWYRNDQEAANAYAVLVSDHRPAVDAARATFAKADAERKAATDRTSLAIDTARRALAALE